MNYKDYTNPETGERTLNGVYVGIRHGAALRDALAPDSDGYDHLRKINRSGSMLQDATGRKNEPLDE
ncbi:hypothetical protein LAD12857_49620 [Lacrimispora amygdalina]|uniref:Transposase n=1 Tax=Lacrimispora amygdalina TaxID=253257 RepID=A0ABQ5MDU1_9FIRM